MIYHNFQGIPNGIYKDYSLNTQGKPLLITFVQLDFSLRLKILSIRKTLFWILAFAMGLNHNKILQKVSQGNLTLLLEIIESFIQPLSKPHIHKEDNYFYPLLIFPSYCLIFNMARGDVVSIL